MAKSDACPCAHQAAYPACCGRYHAGAVAPSADALMRSRYSAYVLGDAAYLLSTWHATTRPAGLDLDAEPRPKWLGLEITRHDTLDSAHAVVEFVARYKINGRAFRMHETSRFVREDGRWYYVDGDVSA
jgi:SEC-C motif-containing protein